MNKKIIGIICIVLLILAIIFIPNAYISNQILTKENFESLVEKYRNKNENTDNLIYFSYATTYYMFQDGLSSAFDFSKTNEDRENEMYKNIYGKSINDLIKEGKKLMKENNMTVEKYRNTFKNASDALQNIIND